jgi:hypothetical protein
VLKKKGNIIINGKAYELHLLVLDSICGHGLILDECFGGIPKTIWQTPHNND